MPNTQVLLIEPQNELRFKLDGSGCFETDQTIFMHLTNPMPDTVLFKIKTTAPKKYCVRPNSGVLKTNEKIEVAIKPHPVRVQPGDTHSHKFLVQSVYAPESYTTIDQVFAHSKSDQLMNLKLTCVFDAPHHVVVKQDAADGAAPAEDKRKEEAAPAPPLKAEPTLQLRKTNKSENIKSDLKKATSEVIILREAESKLRQENLQLKETLSRLRLNAERPPSYAPQPAAARAPWPALAVAMALLGLLIGKFLV